MLNNNKGSMPLWISALGALSLMGIITGTQQIMQGFVASKADHHLKVKYNSATKWAINLSAYLITNNLVLCRKEKWDTTNNNKCKWNSSAPLPTDNPSHFNLSNESFSGGKLSYDLSTPDEVDFNLAEDIKVVFDLVDWGASNELKKVVGNIPGGVCRNNTTRAVDKTCPVQTCVSDTDCSASPNKCISGVCSCCGTGTTFEAISSLDQDYDVVIVEIIAGENTANQMKDYVGVRRPLSRLILNFEESPKCALRCDVGSAASSSASCRSALKTDNTTVKVKVFNQGPGALYDLSLLREARMRSKLETCTNDNDCSSGGILQKCDKPAGATPTDPGVCVGRKVINLTDIVQNNTPPACTVDADCASLHSSATCDTVSNVCVTPEVLLPGDFFTFEDTIICENSSGTNTYFPEWDIQTIREKLIAINNDTTPSTDTLSQNVNVYSEKFMELKYRLDLTTPETDTAPADTANIEPKRIFHHGNIIGLPDSISTAFMIYEPPN